MPYKRKSRKPRRRRRYKRSRASRMQVARPRRSLFGNSLVVKMKYVYLGQISTLVGIPIPLSFRANGPYDPDVALGGTQPRGWDQISSMWERSTCTHSKCRVNFLPEGYSEPGDHHPIICYLQLSKHPAPAILTPRDALESRDVTAAPWVAGQGARGMTRTKSFNAAKFFSVVDILDSPEFSGGPGGLPAGSHQAYYNLSFSPTHVASHSACDVVVTIDYTVVFTNPVQPPPS